MGSKTLVAVLLALCCVPVTLAATTPDGETAASSAASHGGRMPGVLVGGALPLEQALGDVGSAACCQSDPCPGTGVPVSCCSTSCSASSSWVYCSGQGYTYCPVATCNPGASCFDDYDCGGSQGYGYCDKEPFQIEGSCVCYF